MRKVMAPPPAAMTRIPLSPGQRQQTQPAKSSNNDADMIARLISENKSLHEKLSTLTAKENTAPPPQLGPRYHPGNGGEEELVRSEGYQRFNPEQPGPVQQGYPRYFPEQLHPGIRQAGHSGFCGYESFGRALGYPVNAERSVSPYGPYSDHFSHSSLEARLREERLSAALYQSELESQQRERELRAFYIRYGYPHNNNNNK